METCKPSLDNRIENLEKRLNKNENFEKKLPISDEAIASK